MNGEDLRQQLKGLEKNGLLGPDEDDDNVDRYKIGSLLTGYIGSESFLEAVVEVVEKVRKYNPEARFVCDPVLGDDGSFYVPEELVEGYNRRLIPIADCVTPNQFETEKLTGVQVKTIDNARTACKALHQMGPRVVFITSVVFDDDDDDDGDGRVGKHEFKNENKSRKITIVASKKIDSADDDKHEMWTIRTPEIPGSFTGTGDVTACLILGHMANHPDNLPLVMEKVINTMYVLIRRTFEGQGKSVRSKELRLIQSKDIIENPPSTYKARKLQ